MPNVLDIRRRIRSVRSTQQITKAMKMVATAKLRKAQERALNSRPFGWQLQHVLNSLVERTESRSHPLLQQRPEERVCLIMVTADKGLAGAFNTNLLKASQLFLAEHPAQRVELELVGRKGRDFYRRRTVPISGEHIGVFAKVDSATVKGIARNAIERFTAGEVDAVYLIFNEFKSVMSQKLEVGRVLPLAAPAASAHPVDYLWEEPPVELLANLLPRYVETQVYHAMLESAAAEHAARMTAMDAATTNAGEMIEKLTLFMNRVRQASITREIIEVVSGAAAT